MVSVKSWFWKALAWFLSRGAAWIRRQRLCLAPEAWRAVRFSYSHYAEDLIVAHLLSEKLRRGERGVYVDIGAFDPFLFSNTLLLHQHGWRGLNVDPNRAQVERFKKYRPNDANVCAAVSDGARPMVFLEYPTAGTNRLAEPTEANLANVTGELPTHVQPMTTVSLTELLTAHLPDAAIDFLTVDCEGEDLKVLNGLDWTRWSPYVVAVEAYDDETRRNVTEFMKQRGYTLVAQAILTLIFVRTPAPVSALRVFA